MESSPLSDTFHINTAYKEIILIRSLAGRVWKRWRFNFCRPRRRWNHNVYTLCNSDRLFSYMILIKITINHVISWCHVVSWCKILSFHYSSCVVGEIGRYSRFFGRLKCTDFSPAEVAWGSGRTVKNNFLYKYYWRRGKKIFKLLEDKL